MTETTAVSSPIYHIEVFKSSTRDRGRADKISTASSNASGEWAYAKDLAESQWEWNITSPIQQTKAYLYSCDISIWYLAFHGTITPKMKNRLYTLGYHAQQVPVFNTTKKPKPKVKRKVYTTSADCQRIRTHTARLPFGMGVSSFPASVASQKKGKQAFH